MDKKKKIIISIIAGSVVVSSAVGISLGIYFSKVKKPEPPVNKLIFNTFYRLNRDDSKIHWEIDLLYYKVEFINYSENNSSRLNFSIDNAQGFYDECISPYISSFLTEYTIEGKKVKLFFYDKAPIYYLEDSSAVLMYAYGSTMGYSFLTPFFTPPDVMVNHNDVITLEYPSSNMDLTKKDNLFLKEVGRYVKLENFDDAKNIFEKHIDSNSFLINQNEKSITTYSYQPFDYYNDNGERIVYLDFDKNVYAKYTFNDNDISLSLYNKYVDNQSNNPTTK